MHTCTHTHMHTCTHAHMHTRTHTHTRTHAHTHTHTHTHTIHTQNLDKLPAGKERTTARKTVQKMVEKR